MPKSRLCLDTLRLARDSFERFAASSASPRPPTLVSLTTTASDLTAGKR